MNRKAATAVLGVSLAAVLAVSYGLYSHLTAERGVSSTQNSLPLVSGLQSAASGSISSRLLSSVPPSSVPAAASARISSKTPQSSAPTAGGSTSALKPTSSAPALSSAIPEEDLAPDFTVYDASGKAVKFSSFRGRPIVLNFWASWCYYCKQELPDFNQAYQKYKSSVQFLFIDWTDGRSETQATGAAYLKSMGYSLPAYYDLNQDAVAKYGLTGIPATFFIDRQGRLIQAGGAGLISSEDLEQGIARIK